MLTQHRRTNILIKVAGVQRTARLLRAAEKMIAGKPRAFPRETSGSLTWAGADNLKRTSIGNALQTATNKLSRRGEALRKRGATMAGPFTAESAKAVHPDKLHNMSMKFDSSPIPKPKKPSWLSRLLGLDEKAGHPW